MASLGVNNPLGDPLLIKRELFTACRGSKSWARYWSALKRFIAGDGTREELEASVKEGFGPTGPNLHNSLVLALLRRAKRKRCPVTIVDCLPISLLSLVRVPKDGFVSQMENQFGQLSGIWYRYWDEELEGDKHSQPKAKVRKLEIEQQNNNECVEKEGSVQYKVRDGVKDPSLLKENTSSDELNLNAAAVSVAKPASEGAENTKIETTLMTQEPEKGGSKKNEEETSKGTEEPRMALPVSSKQGAEDKPVEIVDEDQIHSVEQDFRDESKLEKNKNALDSRNKTEAPSSGYHPKGGDGGGGSDKLATNNVRRIIGISGPTFTYWEDFCLPAAKVIAMQLQDLCTVEQLQVSPSVVSLLAAAANQYTRRILKACTERAEQNHSRGNGIEGKEDEEANCTALRPEHIVYALRNNPKRTRSSKQAATEWEICSLAAAHYLVT